MFDTAAQIRAEIARTAKHLRRKPDDQVAQRQIEALRAQHSETRVAEAVAELVKAAPPLSPATRDRLAVLLRGDGSHGGASQAAA